MATAQRRGELGLDHWIDGTMGIHRRAGRTLVVSPNGPNLAIHRLDSEPAGSDLARDLGAGVHAPGWPIRGLPADVDHASGGPLHFDEDSGLLFLLYHGEYFEAGDHRDYYSFLGLAVSRGDEHFHDLGPIVTSDLDRRDPARHRPVEMGPGAIAVIDGWFHVYFCDRGHEYIRRHLSVARARVDDLVECARANRAPRFTKYADGRFSQPGIGGLSAELLGHTRLWVAWYDVMHLGQHGRWLLLFSTSRRPLNGVPRWNYGVSESTDGITWSAPRELLGAPEPAEILYVSLDSGERDQRCCASDSFDLYRTRASAAYRWDDATVERLRITVDAGSLGVMGEADSTGGELVLRRVTNEDRGAIIALCRASLGWQRDDPNEGFFAWKHDHNPFGTSPAWVAEAPDGSLAGLRVFLRWRFRQPDGTTFSAVRAVDTATHPDWQGKGIFTKLTLGAIPDLRDDDVGVIFNTPNDMSRPGYLKMGWSTVGRVPTAIRPTGVGSLPTMARSRTAAELWSEPSDVGCAAIDLLSDREGVARLLTSAGQPESISTALSPEYLLWRYSFTPLHYRAVPVGDRVEDGLVVFRLRRRGAALECAVADVVVPRGRSARGAVGYISRRSGADYLLRCAGRSGLRDGFIPAPQLGPVLTWRPINRLGVPGMGELSLTLGDIELF